jgi:hypothetical protein
MAATDAWAARSPELLTLPATRAEAVTKHDTNDFTYVSRGIYVGGAGDVAAVMVSGDVVIFSAVPAGTLLPLRCKRINSTNTTATLMVAIS